MSTCFHVLVLQEVVQDVDGRLAGEEHLNNEVGGAAIDGDERARRVHTFDQRHQHLQPHMHHIQRRPADIMLSIAVKYVQLITDIQQKRLITLSRAIHNEQRSASSEED